MSNWATLTRQRTRLPVAADPRAELFHCDRLDCTLTRTACANRHTLAQGRTRDGLSDQAVTYGACVGCPVGQAHLRGDTTPVNQFAEDTRAMQEHSEPSTEPQELQQPQQQHSKDYPERTCMRGRHPFKPTNGTQRGCPDKNCRDRYGGTAAVADGVAAKHAPTAASAFASPAELLEFVGFTVRVIDGPGGQFLHVT